MERFLLILRHGKSAWKGATSDHARPLDPRGRAAAAEIGGRLGSLGWLPELILSSDADRTRETTERLLAEVDAPIAHQLLSALYLPRPDDMLRVAGTAPDSVRCLMLVGHNPACEEVIERLTGERVTMKTANLARLRFDMPWSSLVEAGEGAVQLDALLRPSFGDD